MRVKLELDIDTEHWENELGVKCNEEEALKILGDNANSMWSDLLYAARLRRVEGTNTFTGVI